MATGRGDSGQRSESVRRANLSALVQVLHAEGPLSRSELGERTGLTRSGIRRLVGDLVAAGLVAEAPGESLGLPGRPSPLVRLEPERAVVLALEIAVDSLAMAVVGMGGHVIDLVRVDRPRATLERRRHRRRPRRARRRRGRDVAHPCPGRDRRGGRRRRPQARRLRVDGSEPRVARRAAGRGARRRAVRRRHRS